ncbi:hypothetical protein GQR58_029276 [Nymphon striatum]|nr:hypothetical protein GQR58_029276 [Nymphon striatum]
MADAGFEFEIPPASPAAATFDDTDLAVAQQSGFGIIAGFRDQIANVDVTATGEDPNVTYLSTLSSSEIARFLLTLDGVEPEAGQLKDDAGCNGTASDIAYADWVAFSEGLASYTTMGEERDTHPDWVAARLLWRDCMIERGFDYTEPDAIRTDVIARMRETVNNLYPGGQLPIVESGDGVALDPALDDLLAELTQFEVAAATANVECTAPLAADFAAVEFEVQQAFVDRNRSTIDELLGR